MIAYDPIVMMFESLFLYGILMDKNKAINTDENIKSGRAYIGSIENTAIIILYKSFLPYRIRTKEIPNLFYFCIPR